MNKIKYAVLGVLMVGFSVVDSLAAKNYGRTEFWGNISVENWVAISNVTSAVVNGGGTYTTGTNAFVYRVAGSNSAGRLPSSTNVAVTFVGTTTSNAVKLTWERYQGLSKIVILRSTDAGTNFSFFRIAQANPTSFTDTGLQVFSTNDFEVGSLIPDPTFPWIEGTASNLFARRDTTNTFKETNTFDNTVFFKSNIVSISGGVTSDVATEAFVSAVAVNTTNAFIAADVVVTVDAQTANNVLSNNLLTADSTQTVAITVAYTAADDAATNAVIQSLITNEITLVMTQDVDFTGSPTIQGVRIARTNTPADGTSINLSNYNDDLGHRQYPVVDSNKLTGIQSGATSNQTDAFLLARTNHTGTQLSSTISDFQLAVSNNVKLSGIAFGATSNSTDAFLLNRTNHIGTQLAVTISDFDNAASNAIKNVVTFSPTGLWDFAEIISVNGSNVLLSGSIREYPVVDSNKLSGIEFGATSNSTDVFLLARANHTGTQLAITISDFQSAVSNNVKLSGIEFGATSNSTDVFLLARANHTGTQLASTISDFQSSVSNNVKLSGIEFGATSNSTDAFLLDRNNHTGAQLASTISDFQSTVSNNVLVAGAVQVEVDPLFTNMFDFPVFQSSGSIKSSNAGDDNSLTNSVDSVLIGGTAGSLFNSDFSFIGGGEDTVISAGGGAGNIILGGASGQILTGSGAPSFNSIIGGDGQTIYGGISGNQNSGIFAGDGHIITNSDGSVILGGGGGFIADSAQSGILAGNTVKIIGSSLGSAAIGSDRGVVSNANFSLIFGTRPRALHSGTIVFSDLQNADFDSTTNNQFSGRFANGYRLTGGPVFIGNTLGVGIENPDPSALVEMVSTNKGFLPPRMTPAQRDAIASPATLLMVGDLSNNKIDFFNGTTWQGFLSAPASSLTIGEILFATAGHEVDGDPGFTWDDATKEFSATFISSSKSTSAAGQPIFQFEETDAAADARKWRFQINGGIFKLETLNDAETVFAPRIEIVRSSGLITFKNGNVIIDNSLTMGGSISSATDDLDITTASGGVFKFNSDAIRAGLDAIEYVEVGHGGGNGFVNAVGDGGLDFRFEGNTLATFTDFGHLHLLTDVDQKHTLKIKTANNANDTGMAWENSGGAFTHTIFRTDVGANRADLIFAAGINTDIDLLVDSFKIHGAAGIEGKLEILDSFQISIGTPVINNVWTASDTNGNGFWQAPVAPPLTNTTTLAFTNSVNFQDRVGIGVIDPDAKLEVNGQVKITGGSPGVGKVLVSTNANGLAAWENRNPTFVLEGITPFTNYVTGDIADGESLLEGMLVLSFSTGSDITTTQMIWEAGGTAVGTAFRINNGNFEIASGNDSTIDISTPVLSNTIYTSIIHVDAPGDLVSLYLRQTADRSLVDIGDFISSGIMGSNDWSGADPLGIGEVNGAGPGAMLSGTNFTGTILDATLDFYSSAPNTIPSQGNEIVGGLVETDSSQKPVQDVSTAIEFDRVTPDSSMQGISFTAGANQTIFTMPFTGFLDASANFHFERTSSGGIVNFWVWFQKDTAGDNVFLNIGYARHKPLGSAEHDVSVITLKNIAVNSGDQIRVIQRTDGAIGDGVGILHGAPAFMAPARVVGCALSLELKK